MHAWRAFLALSQLVGSLVVVLIFLHAEIGLKPSALAGSPGLDFSIGIDADGDGSDDCNTSGGPATCRLPAGTFTLSLYLRSVPEDVSSYDGFDFEIWRFGVIAGDAPIRGKWVSCGYLDKIATVVGGCVIPGGGESSFLGPVVDLDFDCGASGSLALLHGNGRTTLTSNNQSLHESDMPETLTIECGDPPLTAPPADRHGDADCDGRVSSLDALLMLQFQAELLVTLPCPRNADVWKNGGIFSLDAFAVLEYVAGLIDSVPALGPLPP
jgi:hypothetical protein